MNIVGEFRPSQRKISCYVQNNTNQTYNAKKHTTEYQR